MKKTLPYLFVLLMVGMIVSCHKDPVPNNGGNEQPIDSILPGNDSIIPVNDSILPVNDSIIPVNDSIIPASDLVTFSDTAGMIVKKYPKFNPMENVDLNDDDQPDIQFFTELVGSAGLGHDYVTTLKCKHRNIQLLGDIIQQEKYLHMDSTYHSEDSIWWVIGVYFNYTCEQVAETDSVVSVTEKLSLYANDANDSFDNDDTFMSKDVILKDRSYSYPAGYENGDHVLYHYEVSYWNDCDYFPMEEEKYIGFRITKNDESRLGWMKIILHEDHVELLETAIQKESLKL